MQNKHDIQNQHEKLHRMTYISSKNIFRQNSDVLPLRSIFPCGPPRSNFDEKYFLMKYMSFDVVFHADSEYRVYFA